MGLHRSKRNTSWVLAALACTALIQVGAQIVPLQNATATSSYDSRFAPAGAIDGNTSVGGWIPSGSGAPETIVFETQNDVGFDGGSLLTFTLFQADSLGRFRLSVTTDDRDTFANGLATGGNVGAHWTVLQPVTLTDAYGATLIPMPDNSLLASGGRPDTAIYTVMAYTPLTHITGVRLEALTDPSLPYNGPGRNAGGGFRLMEFQTRVDPVDCGFDGALDTTWAARMPTFSAEMRPFVDPQRRVFLSSANSTFLTAGPPYSFSLLRLTAEGSPDTSFYAGDWAVANVQRLGFLSDGTIVFCGGSVNGSPPFGLIGSSGALEQSLGLNLYGSVNALALQPDGKILIGGNLGVPTGNPSDPSRGGVVRFNSDFTVDLSWNVGSGPGILSRGQRGVLDIVRQPDGKILVGGDFASFNGQPQLGVVRLNSDGSLDPGFVTDWTVLAPYLEILTVNRLALLPDGRILIGGQFSYRGNASFPAYYGSVLRLNSDGSIDPSFVASQSLYVQGGPGSPSVNDFALQADGRIIMGGNFSAVGGLPRVNLARLNSDGSVDPSFMPDGLDWYPNFGGVGAVLSLALQDEGHAIVTGDFNGIGGVPLPRVARILTAPSRLIITTQPQNQNAIAGNPVTFSVLATGTKPIGYQWRKNGIPIPGAYARTLSLAQAALSDAGNYDVVVTNPGGSLTSAAVLLVVASPVVPQSYDMPNGEGPYDDTYSGAGSPMTALSPLSGGSGQLIDGIIGGYIFDNLNDLSLRVPWVGWQSIDPEITFDFGARHTFQQIAIHAEANLHWEVRMFSHAEISFGDDGVSFGPVSSYWVDGEIIGSAPAVGEAYFGSVYEMSGLQSSGSTFAATAGEAADGARWITIPVLGSGRFARLKLYRSRPAPQFRAFPSSVPPPIHVSEVRFGEAPTTSPPVPDVATLPTLSDQCSVTIASRPTATASDGTKITGTTTDPLAYTAQGTYTVTWQYADGQGNTTTQTQTVVVKDTIPPLIAGCPGNITVETGSGRTTCDRMATWTPPSASDNCALASLSSDHHPGDTFPVGTTTVTCTAIDGAGNASSCSFNVTVVDTTPPVIIPPVDISVSTDPGQCSAVVHYPAPAATDNCSVANVVCSPASGTAFPLGVTTVNCTAADAAGNAALCRFTVSVVNPAPQVTIVGPASGAIYPVGTAVNFNASFTDNDGDVHTAQWMFDSTPVAGTVNESTHQISGTYTFSAPGVYFVKLIVTDACANRTTAATIDGLSCMVVIYDPNGGFVTGGGWINSPAGAFPAQPALVGKANFGFVSKYEKGATIPTGETEFQFNVAGLNFHSTTYEWLVVSGAKAQYKGSGQINGAGAYGFLLTASDGQLSGGGGTDKFRIKIWDKSTSAIAYDNMIGASDGTDPTTMIAGGSIVIHK
jgi:uncharacterized delta-60 repeat protein